MESSGREGASPRIRAVIRIHGLGRDRAEALLAALRPDDRDAPSWLSITERVEDGDLVVVVEVKGGPARLGSLRNTVDEILVAAYALLRSIEEATKTL